MIEFAGPRRGGCKGHALRWQGDLRRGNCWFLKESSGEHQVFGGVTGREQLVNLEGLVAKRRNSTYEAGRRSGIKASASESQALTPAPWPQPPGHPLAGRPCMVFASAGPEDSTIFSQSFHICPANENVTRQIGVLVLADLRAEDVG